MSEGLVQRPKTIFMVISIEFYQCKFDESDSRMALSGLLRP
jgi:hypothetical protein